MKPKKILIIGAGGHGRVILDAILLGNEWEAGIVEQKSFPHKNVLGVPVVGTDDELPKLKASGWEYAIIGIGSIGDTAARRRAAEMIERAGLKHATIIHPAAIVSPHAEIASGAVVFPGAIVNAGAFIGHHAIINSGAIVEHDCQIGDFVHVAPGVRLGGNVNIGHDTHIGIGATVRESLQIGQRCLIGAASLVLKDVSDDARIAGAPARPISEHSKK